MISILYDIFTLLCSLVSSFPYSSLSYLSLRATHAMPPVLHHHPLSCLIVHCMSWSISHLTPTSPCFCIKVACRTALAFGTRPRPSEIKLSLNFSSARSLTEREPFVVRAVDFAHVLRIFGMTYTDSASRAIFRMFFAYITVSVAASSSRNKNILF